MNRNYCIKENYHPNLQPRGIDVYWTPERISMSSNYQYYVYFKSKQLLVKHNLKGVLDVGCGPAPKVKELIWPLCQDVVLVDHPVVAPIAKATLPMAEFFGADLDEVSVDLGRCFELVICADVIEHLVNPDPCLAFIRRHLASHGFAVVSTPERDIVRGPDCDHCRKPEHVREWNTNELSLYIQSRGFQIVEHLSFPPTRISRLEFLISRAAPRYILRDRWFSGQVVICKHPNM